MTRKFMLSVLVGLSVLSCGRATDDKRPPVVENRVRLVVFGADWCPNCTKDLPEVQKGLKARLGDRMSRLDFQLWVPTGKKILQKPTPEAAEEYRQKVGLEASVHVDEWHWKRFKALFPEVPPALPAGALLNEKDEMIQAFPPGATSFVAEDIVSRVDKALQ